MTKRILAIFPGQGSQKVGMGKVLYDAAPRAKELFDIADQALGFSLSSLCFDGPIEKLTATEIAQPAILTVSTICFELYASRNNNFQVCAGAGHSLGEYSALVASGVLRFEDAVKLVHKRGKFMQQAVAPGNGKMVAVLGKEVKEIEAATQSVNSGVVQIANINAPGQVVVAGDRAAVDAFCAAMSGSKIIELQVSAPFHCALMKPAENALAPELAAVTFSSPKFPVYSNFHAKPADGLEEIRDALKHQVCGRVRWTECIENAIAECRPDEVVEFGSGNVLTGLMKRINSSIPRIAYEGC